MLDAPMFDPVVRKLSLIDVVPRIERYTAVGVAAGVQHPLNGLLDLPASDCLVADVLQKDTHTLRPEMVAGLACDLLAVAVDCVVVEIARRIDEIGHGLKAVIAPRSVGGALAV